MTAFLAGFIVSSTAILTVVLGVFGAHCAIRVVLAAFDPARPAVSFRILVPHQNHVSGD